MRPENNRGSVKKTEYRVDLENGDTLVNMLDYLCSKITWEKKGLDADAITCLNILFLELEKDKRIIRP